MTHKENNCFSLVIPALNEQESITSVIERSIETKKKLINNKLISDMQIIVIDDGSTDNTADIARGFSGIDLHVHKSNKGYGAALKQGFKMSRGEIVGFMDADDTCDPANFFEMINALQRNNADIVIGSRLGKESKMPPIRRIGNKAYAYIINFLANVKIRDCASGMRIFKKDVLKKLYPLPDGLHFTPEMSCKALMGPGIKIIEVPMYYKERKGRSKLNLLKDGQRFLRTIFEVAIFYRPFKFLFTIGSILIFLSIAYAIKPISFYISNRFIVEGDIYRLISIVIFFIVGVNFMIMALLSDALVALMNDSRSVLDKCLQGRARRIFCPRTFLQTGVLISLSGILLNIETIRVYFATGKIFVHWVYLLVGGFLVLLGAQIFTYGILSKILSLYKQKSNYSKEDIKGVSKP